MPIPCDLIVRADHLVTCAPGDRPRKGPGGWGLEVVADGLLAVRDGKVVHAGPASEAQGCYTAPLEHQTRCVVPGLVDAHTHPVWAGNRFDEFALRAAGATYQEIMARGGGIHSTVRATRAATRDELVASTRATFERMLAQGTTTVEAKSGYGLDQASELRDLEVIAAASALSRVRTVATYLGAHAVPVELQGQRDEVVRAIIDETLPLVARRGLAEMCDVFCEEGAFTLDESRRILEAARDLGLGLKAHVEEFAYLGGARMAAGLGAVSVDHLLSLPESDFPALAASDTVAVLLPGTTIFLGKGRYAPARGLIDAGAAVAVATDYNAGSCMTDSLPMALSLAVLALRMSPAEALLAGTVNAAHALARGHEVGSLEPGKAADFVVLDVDDYREWFYRFGVPMVREVWVGGRCAVRHENTAGRLSAEASAAVPG